VATRRTDPGGRGEQARSERELSRAVVVPANVVLDDVAIVTRLRTGEPIGFEDFVERFHRVLLDYARRASVDAHERDEFVRDVLADAALHFLALGSSVPSNPRLYLITTFRNKLLNKRRGRLRQEKTLSSALRDAAADSEYADEANVVAGCSEARVRESRGPGWERAPLRGALERLSAHLSEALTAEERQLLVAVAENVPQRQVAEWLGVSHSVARKRLERLRGRMVQVAMRYTNALEPNDARELQRFLRRCRARIGASIPTRQDVAHNSTEQASANMRDGSDDRRDGRTTR